MSVLTGLCDILANMKVFWMGVGSCSHLDAARNLMSHALKLDPNFRKVTDRIPFRRSDLVARWEDALRKAGLPE